VILLQQPLPERPLGGRLRAAAKNFIHKLALLAIPFQFVVNERADAPGIAQTVANGLARDETAMAFPARTEDVGETRPVGRLANPFATRETGAQRSELDVRQPAMPQRRTVSGRKLVDAPRLEPLDGVGGPGFLAAELGLHVSAVRRVAELLTEMRVVVHVVGADGEEGLALGIHQPPAPVHLGGAEKTFAWRNCAPRTRGPRGNFG